MGEPIIVAKRPPGAQNFWWDGDERLNGGKTVPLLFCEAKTFNFGKFKPTLYRCSSFIKHLWVTEVQRRTFLSSSVCNEACLWDHERDCRGLSVFTHRYGAVVVTGCITPSPAEPWLNVMWWENKGWLWNEPWTAKGNNEKHALEQIISKITLKN